MQVRLLALGAVALAALVQPAQAAPDAAQMMKTLDQASECRARAWPEGRGGGGGVESRAQVPKSRREKREKEEEGYPEGGKR